MDTHLTAIKEYFITLKKGFLWMKERPDDIAENEAMIKRAKKDLFPKGIELGVSEEFSAALLVFGPAIDWDIIKQFSLKSGS